MGVTVFPPCYLPRTNYGGGNEDNGDLLQKVPCMHCYTQCPQPCSRPLPATPGHFQAGLGQSFVRSLLLFSGSWCTQGSVCALQELISQTRVSSGGSIVGLMATFSKRCLCYTQVRCTQSPCLCSGPLLTRTSVGDTQT